MESYNFNEQIKKCDILYNLLNNVNMSSSDIFKLIISDNFSNPSSQRKGAIFESLCILLQISKFSLKLRKNTFLQILKLILSKSYYYPYDYYYNYLDY